mmetsp:Transcript_70076/g.194798  ORF Transcript_70076/g.194798 Transcript_70076/m.194798 type:complete len:215 (+) Transcript_70076:1780-2424(+)
MDAAIPAVPRIARVAVVWCQREHAVQRGGLCRREVARAVREQPARRGKGERGILGQTLLPADRAPPRGLRIAALPGRGVLQRDGLRRRRHENRRSLRELPFVDLGRTDCLLLPQGRFVRLQRHGALLPGPPKRAIDEDIHDHRRGHHPLPLPFTLQHFRVAKAGHGAPGADGKRRGRSRGQRACGGTSSNRGTRGGGSREATGARAGGTTWKRR